MTTHDVSEALDAWREAERRWERARADAPRYRDAAIDVLTAWLRYQELTDPEPGSFVLVADEGHAYVAVGGGVKAALGYEPTELLGRRVEDISTAALAAQVRDAWDRFLTEGRQDGEYRLIARDGHEVPLRFQARAHHPIPGFHTSRLWPVVIQDERDRVAADA